MHSIFEDYDLFLFQNDHPKFFSSHLQEIKEDYRKYRSVNLILVSGKALECILLENITKCCKDKKVILRS